MEARLTELNFNEILMYLGHCGQEVTPEMEAQIKECAKKVTEAAEPKFTYMILPVYDKEISGCPIEGDDIGELLETSHEAVLFAATLGSAVEQLLMRNEVTNMSDALIMDACASVAIENVANNFEEDFRKAASYQGLFITSRFSPGYGDMPIETQQRLCDILYTSKRIGLNVTDNSIMVPRKSVTAVMGISGVPQKLRKSGCEACDMFMTCQYRKDGEICK